MNPDTASAAASEAVSTPVSDAADPQERAALHERLVAALKQIYDPEIPVNIYDLGLIYRLEITPQRQVQVDMTLTAPGCPVAQTFPATVEAAIAAVAGVASAQVNLVWEPPWTPERLPDEIKLQLGLL